MKPFLEIVSQDLFSKYGEKISETTLVFPSRRAALFFNIHLSKLISKPIWLPSIVSIDELMQQVSGLTIDDPLRLVSKLYHVYNRVRGVNEPFENFYFWGDVMLTDFDQVDKYLVNPKQLFTNIKDIKEIEEKFGELTAEQTDILKDYLGIMNADKVSDLRKNYLDLWEKLLDIYTQFRNELDLESLAYEGMVYRKAAQILDSKSEVSLPNHIIFIGFNALNECEKVLFKRCKKDYNTLFYWDYDPVFLDNTNHEAGIFIRQNLSLFPNALSRDVIEENTIKDKTIRIIAAPSTVSQTKLIPKLLSELEENGAKLDISTAIVFPKENLLLPALQAIPKKIESLNITMGYPTKETPAFSLIDLLIRLQINAKKVDEDTTRFYHKDVLGVFNHPYIRIIDQNTTRSVVTELKKRNRIYTTNKEIAKSSLLSQIFCLQSENDLIDYLINISKEIAINIASFSKEEDNNKLRIELEFLYALHKSLTRAKGILMEKDILISHKTLLQIIRKIFIQERVSFSGEPLSGLQIMGFLETRSLDFENLVVLSFNDDILPGRNHPISFITPSLRVAYGLPNYKYHDAVYAYYFYRLLARSKRVFLVYSGRTEGMSSGEISRFGLQLEMEQMIGKVEKISVGYNLELTPPLAISIEKSDDVIDSLLKNINKKDKGITLSPSALTTYLHCPLRFYFRYVSKIAEDDDVTEEVGALEFGRIIHGVMEEIYKKYNGRTVLSATVNQILNDSIGLEAIVNKVFNEVFLNISDSSIEGISGRNLLALNAILYTIKRMLQLDAARAPFELISHEKEAYFTVNLNGNDQIEKVKVGGFIDRIERVQNTIWSIDYKTGRHEGKGNFKHISDLFLPEKIDNHKEVLQTFCYSLALQELYPSSPIKPALWFVKVAKAGSDFDIKFGNKPINDFSEYEQEFRGDLKSLISEIFDSSVPFSQTTDDDKCKNCPYKTICGKD